MGIFQDFKCCWFLLRGAVWVNQPNHDNKLLFQANSWHAAWKTSDHQQIDFQLETHAFTGDLLVAFLPSWSLQTMLSSQYLPKKPWLQVVTSSKTRTNPSLFFGRLRDSVKTEGATKCRIPNGNASVNVFPFDRSSPWHLWQVKLTVKHKSKGEQFMRFMANSFILFSFELPATEESCHGTWAWLTSLASCRMEISRLTIPRTHPVGGTPRWKIHHLVND